MRRYDVPGSLNPYKNRNVRIVALMPERSDERSLGEAVVSVLGEPPALLALSTRSTGAAKELGQYFQSHESYWTTTTIGVRSTLVAPLMPHCIGHLRSVVTVDHGEAPLRMRQLWRFAKPRPGPTSGLAFAGLLKYLEVWLATCDSAISTSAFSADTRRYGCTAAFLCLDQVAE
jgi:hypothetical protein